MYIYILLFKKIEIKKKKNPRYTCSFTLLSHSVTCRWAHLYFIFSPRLSPHFFSRTLLARTKPIVRSTPCDRKPKPTSRFPRCRLPTPLLPLPRSATSFPSSRQYCAMDVSLLSSMVTVSPLPNYSLLNS
jgi:hypothetical protein